MEFEHNCYICDNIQSSIAKFARESIPYTEYISENEIINTNASVEEARCNKTSVANSEAVIQRRRLLNCRAQINQVGEHTL